MTKHARKTEDGPTVPCFYSDFSTIEDRGETVRVTHFIAGIEGTAALPQVAISYPRSVFLATLMNACAKMMPDLGERGGRLLS